ncbi:MAG TPA: protein-L-isoaspartate(D-aspartate) O-methyltransferase [Vulgatibacter sp.]|nr:protein-L-isoaspartate(D-aspartate) O-methyltransferase [Vulgatibacter sp.]
MDDSVGPRLAIASQLAGVRDERVLAAMAAVDRRFFVPPHMRPLAQEDAPIPIPHRQTTSQPSLVAQMGEALHLSEGDRVLEVGTGLGYQAAVLSLLCGRVVSIERFADLADQARANLRAAGIDNVEVVHGDGMRGHPPLAPYDAIVVAAAAPRVPRPLVEQLAEGGVLVQPIGPGGAEEVTAFTKKHGALENPRPVVGATFVPLVSDRSVGEEP